MKNIECFMNRCVHHHASTHTLIIVDQHVDHNVDHRVDEWCSLINDDHIVDHNVDHKVDEQRS